MKPTMKLRWRRANHGDSCVAFGEQWRSGFSDEWEVLNGYVLQQWWEGTRIKKGYEGCTIVQYDPDEGIPQLYEPYGEWRDIPIEEEKSS